MALKVVLDRSKIFVKVLLSNVSFLFFKISYRLFIESMSKIINRIISSRNLRKEIHSRRISFIFPEDYHVSWKGRREKEKEKSVLEDTRIPRQVAFLANLSRDEDRNKSLVGLRRGAWMAEACRETTKFSLASKAEGIMRRDGRGPTACASSFRARCSVITRSFN